MRLLSVLIAAGLGLGLNAATAQNVDSDKDKAQGQAQVMRDKESGASRAATAAPGYNEAGDRQIGLEQFRVEQEACGSMSEAMHRTGMLDMANRLYGGGILRLPEALKALAGQNFDGWRCTRPVEFAYTLENVDRLYEAL